MERVHDRLSDIVVIAIVFVFAAAAAAITFAHVVGQNDGARIDTATASWSSDGIRILSVDPEGPFRNGDIIVAIDGVPMDRFVENLLHPDRWLSLEEAANSKVYTVVRDGVTFDAPIDMYDYPLVTMIGRGWDVWLMTFSFFALGLLVFLKKPSDPAAKPLLLMGTGAAFSTVSFFTVQVPDLQVGWPYLMEIWLQQAGYPLMLAALVHFCLVFPQPLPLVVRHRWIIPLVYVVPFAWATVRMAGATWDGSMLDIMIALETSWTLPTVLYFVAALAGLVVNWRHTTDPVGRQKVRWVVFGLGAHVLFRLLLWNLPSLLVGHPLIVYDLLIPTTLLLPASIAIAILRYNLFDIDLIISRTLLWTTLTVLVIGSYAAIVAFVDFTLKTRSAFGPSVVAAGVIAVLFDPARKRVQQTVNHVVYGDRDEPYAVVTRLGQRLEATMEPSAVLPTITETIAQALKLPYVAIVLGDGSSTSVRTAVGTPGGQIMALPLVYQSDTIGELHVAARDRGTGFSRADRQLIEDLARQIGVAAHAVRLTEELQRSRERIVSAREEERRRLRRDLHDGVGPSLASIVLRLETARNQLTNHPAEVGEMLGQLTTQTQNAIADVRRVVYDLRPPAIDELGLVGAIHEYAARLEHSQLRMAISTSGSLNHLPAAVEVAAYRIVVEAITNVARHAEATRCVVSVTAATDLQISVGDNGTGMNSTVRSGVGQSAMRERAEELGGRLEIRSTAQGVTVLATIPLQGAGDDG